MLYFEFETVLKFYNLEARMPLNVSTDMELLMDVKHAHVTVLSCSEQT